MQILVLLYNKRPFTTLSLKRKIVIDIQLNSVGAQNQVGAGRDLPLLDNHYKNNEIVKL